MITRNRFIACSLIVLTIISGRQTQAYRNSICFSGGFGLWHRWLLWYVWRTWSMKKQRFIYKVELRSFRGELIIAWLLCRFKPELRGADYKRVSTMFFGG